MTRRGFTTTVGSITDLDPPATLSARARKMCPEEVRARGGRITDGCIRTVFLLGTAFFLIFNVAVRFVSGQKALV